MSLVDALTPPLKYTDIGSILLPVTMDDDGYIVKALSKK